MLIIELIFSRSRFSSNGFCIMSKAPSEKSLFCIFLVSDFESTINGSDSLFWFSSRMSNAFFPGSVIEQRIRSGNPGEC